MKLQQQRYQKLNDARQQQLLSILKTEQHVQQKHPQATAAISSSPKQVMQVAAPHDLWSSMRDHFSLTSSSHPDAVKHQLAWYLAHRWVVNMIIKNSEPYLGYVYQQTQKRGMPAEFALLPMVESGYVPFAKSSAGASGLWQIMPNTASSTGLDINWWYDGRLDAVNSTKGALDYLVQLHGGLHSWALAAAAYNDGEGGVLAALDYNKRKGLSTSYWDLPLPQQTRDYVPKLLALAEIIKNPSKYGFKLPSLTTDSNFATITLHSQIDRAQIADLAGTTEEVVHELNPGMLRWATEPHGSYSLAIPADKLSTFKINLARLANQKRLLWEYHAVSGNQSLSDIASSYHTTVAELQKVNRLDGTQLQNGQGLIVPVISNKTYATFSPGIQQSNAEVQVAQRLSRSATKTVVKPTTTVASTSTAAPASGSVDSVTANGLLNGSYDAPAGSTTAPAQQKMVQQASLSASSANNGDLKSLMKKLYE